jgi:hypothetical protein
MMYKKSVSRRYQLQFLGALAGGMGLPWLIGCGDPRTQALDDLRRKVLVSERPQEATSLAVAYANFKERTQVTVVGRIFSSLGSPFDPHTAAFNLIELPKPGHTHDDPGDCPFCKRDMENAASALVQIVDTTGAVLMSSADKLIGLTKNQDVVVTGAATKVGEIMLISTQALHILSPEDSLDFAQRIHS